MISEKGHNEIYLKGCEYGKNDKNSLKIHYEIKPSFTTRKLKELQQENEQLKAELQEANDNIIWWSNRFKAVQRDYENLKEVIDETINKLYCWGEALNPIFQKEMLVILKEVSE